MSSQFRGDLLSIEEFPGDLVKTVGLPEFEELLGEERLSTVLREDEITLLNLQLSTASSEAHLLEEEREELQTEVEKWQRRALEVERLNRDLRAQLALIASAPRMLESQQSVSDLQLEKLKQKSDEMYEELAQTEFQRKKTLSRMEEMADELSTESLECEWHQSRVKQMESESIRLRALVSKLQTEKQCAKSETEMLRVEMVAMTPSVIAKTSMHKPSDTLTLDCGGFLLDDVYDDSSVDDDEKTPESRSSFAISAWKAVTPVSASPLKLGLISGSQTPDYDSDDVWMDACFGLKQSETALIDSDVEGAVVVEDAEADAEAVNAMAEKLKAIEERVRVLEAELIETRHVSEERCEESAEHSSDDESASDAVAQRRRLKRTGCGLQHFDAIEAQTGCLVCGLW